AGGQHRRNGEHGGESTEPARHRVPFRSVRSSMGLNWAGGPGSATGCQVAGSADGRPGDGQHETEVHDRGLPSDGRDRPVRAAATWTGSVVARAAGGGEDPHEVDVQPTDQQRTDRPWSFAVAPAHGWMLTFLSRIVNKPGSLWRPF